MTKGELEDWIDRAHCSAIAVSIVSRVAAESDFALELEREWIKADNEIIESCVWSTMSNYISITEDKIIDMNEIRELLDIIETDIHNNKKNHERLMRIIKKNCEKNNIICGAEEVFKYMKTFAEKNNEVQVSFDI